ncbi:hypothetical protein M514_18116 [Trichuris suis]|uniref:Uncharacterized protein n=1 Tax=Trichuris suis TaxID=68888 RepID=A0A085NJT5_9BILA|nr:hypothetical protein M514_18116 [Trichuris suis]
MARYSPHKPICQPVMQPAHCIDIMFLQQKDMSESNLRKHAVVAVESSLASFCRYSRIFAGVMEIPAAVVKLCGPACIIKRLTSSDALRQPPPLAGYEAYKMVSPFSPCSANHRCSSWSACEDCLHDKLLEHFAQLELYVVCTPRAKLFPVFPVELFLYSPVTLRAFMQSRDLPGIARFPYVSNVPLRRLQFVHHMGAFVWEWEKGGKFYPLSEKKLTRSSFHVWRYRLTGLLALAYAEPTAQRDTRPSSAPLSAPP